MKKHTTKKRRNQAMVGYIQEYLPQKSLKRFRECASWIEFLADEHREKLKVNRANFCNNRFCPMCAWRKSAKDAMQVSVLLEYLEKEHNLAFVFLTLTAPNVKGDALGAEITRYNKAFKELMRDKKVMRAVKGFVRKLEVTYNRERNDYHPHFHCVLAVRPSYFKNRQYIPQAYWLGLWRDVMRDYSITQVDVRRVVRGKDSNEIGKYAAKEGDMMHNKEVFDCFYHALKGRQILTFGGCFLEANKKYKAKELENYKSVDKTDYVWLLLVKWFGMEYAEKSLKLLEASGQTKKVGESDGNIQSDNPAGPTD